MFRSFFLLTILGQCVIAPINYSSDYLDIEYRIRSSLFMAWFLAGLVSKGVKTRGSLDFCPILSSILSTNYLSLKLDSGLCALQVFQCCRPDFERSREKEDKANYKSKVQRTQIFFSRGR